ncbi:MAG: serine/threonine-protein phosphatase [Cyanobacteria bacterium SZAS LIN-2]|nr:serine/threonine-protein phosphatase [Cyanobacteria bacterium SZAS LIN-3]MBS1997061.1 serine/threonine-protein phosphatase [Cyanobacteria bacterium SZAS LIN-2]
MADNVKPEKAPEGADTVKDKQAQALSEKVQGEQQDSKVSAAPDTKAAAHLPKLELVAHTETSTRKLNEKGEYVVQGGESLGYIAKDLLGPGASTKDIYNFVNVIAKDNQLDSANKIGLHQHLKIRQGHASEPDAAQPEHATGADKPAAQTPVKEGQDSSQKGAQKDGQVEPVQGVVPDKEQPAGADQNQVNPAGGKQDVAPPTGDNQAAVPPVSEGETPGVMAKTGHVAALAVSGAGDYVAEHPVLVAAEAVGGAVVGGVLVATAPAWMTIGAAVGGIGYLGYTAYEKSKEVLPALKTMYEDRPDPTQYAQSENIIKQDLGAGLVDGAIMVAGGVGGKVVAEKMISKAASAGATTAATATEEAEELVIEEGAKHLPAAEQQATNAGNTTASDAAPKTQAQTTQPTDGGHTAPGDAGHTGSTAANAGADSHLDEVAVAAKPAAADKGAAQWTGNKYENADGSFRQEDSHFVSHDGRVAVVADGMGGHGGGDVASKITTDVFAQRMNLLPENASQEQTSAWLRETIEEAASTIKQAQTAKEYIAPDGTRMAATEKMGSTVVATVRHEDKMLIAWAGDSRAYRLRGGKLEQLTRDHSWENAMVDHKIMTLEEAQAQDQGHVITSALGSKLQVGEVVADVKPGDRFLLASDGLETLTSEEIAMGLNPAKAPEEASNSLIQAVKDKHAIVNDYQDNTTAVIIDPTMAATEGGQSSRIFSWRMPRFNRSHPGVANYMAAPLAVDGGNELNNYLEVPPVSFYGTSPEAATW